MVIKRYLHVVFGKIQQISYNPMNKKVAIQPVNGKEIFRAVSLPKTEI